MPCVLLALPGNPAGVAVWRPGPGAGGGSGGLVPRVGLAGGAVSGSSPSGRDVVAVGGEGRCMPLAGPTLHGVAVDPQGGEGEPQGLLLPPVLPPFLAALPSLPFSFLQIDVRPCRSIPLPDPAAAWLAGVAG